MIRHFAADVKNFVKIILSLILESPTIWVVSRRLTLRMSFIENDFGNSDG